MTPTLGRPARFRDEQGAVADVTDAFKSQRMLDLEREVTRLRHELRQAQALTAYGCPFCGFGRQYYGADTTSNYHAGHINYSPTT